MKTNTIRQLIDGFIQASSTMRLRRAIDSEMTLSLTGQRNGAPCDALPTTFLRDGEIWSSELLSTPFKIRVQSGNLWITQSGIVTDTVLSSGQSYSSDGDGKIVIQALSDSVIQIASQTGSRQYRDIVSPMTDSREHD